MHDEYPETLRKVNGYSRNELVSRLIYELTGQMKSRKAVSSHTQVLKGYLHEYQEQLYGVPEAGSPALDGKPTIFTQIPNPPSNLAGILKGMFGPGRNTTITQNNLSLSLVNHGFRTDCIQYLASDTRFDFGLDRHAFQRFCNTVPADLIVSMRHARITMVEGHMPPLPDWPSLCTLQIELWPRDPTRPELRAGELGQHGKWDAQLRAGEWGAQTEELLASLGITLASRARITLEMRWAADCERFERTYVEHGRWTRVGADVEDCPPGRDERFCHRCYEMHGNGGTSVEEKEMQKSFSAAVGRLVG